MHAAKTVAESTHFPTSTQAQIDIEEANQNILPSTQTSTALAQKRKALVVKVLVMDTPLEKRSRLQSLALPPPELAQHGLTTLATPLPNTLVPESTSTPCLVDEVARTQTDIEEID